MYCKRKEIDEIYQFFTRLELDELQNTYEEYLKRFQTKFEELIPVAIQLIIMLD